MGKRLTATEKWEDSWFRRLKPAHKLLWIYLLDKCDLAGIAEFDLELAAFYCGVQFKEDEVKAAFAGKIIAVNGSKVWIPKFIEFQYGCTVAELNESSSVHRGVLKIVARYRLSAIPETLSQPLPNAYVSIKDKDKDKDKNKVKDKDKNREEIPANLANLEGFPEAWERWMMFRGEIKKKLTPSTCRAQLAFLSKQSNPIEAINESIRNGWTGLFATKGQSGKSREVFTEETIQRIANAATAPQSRQTKDDRDYTDSP